MVTQPDSHACAFFDGPKNHADVVGSFIRDGLAAGERVVYLVESPEATRADLAAVMDLAGPLGSGQLELRPWATTYLERGAFNANRMLARVRRLIRESEPMGYRAMRLIGDMDWAAAEIPGVEELAAYESGINTLVARPRVSILCAYDTGRVAPALFAALLTSHDSAFFGGTVHRTPSGVPGQTPRDRILDAAALLFAENGVSRTGIDTLIAAAGVAKATFYRHFRSKDELVVAWLRDPRTRWFDRVKATAEAEARSSADLVRRIFEGAADWLEANDFVGCPYLNTAVELPLPGPASDEARAYLAEIGAYLESQLTSAGRPDAAALGRELHLMLAGAISLGVANGTTAYLLAARDAAVARLTTAAPA
jgi:AcrR family transcriptional regulator